MAASAFKAYLSLIPKLSADAKSNIKSELGGINATSSGKSVGSTLSSGITSGLSAGKIAIGTAIGSVVSTGLNSITSSISDAVSRVDTLNSFPKIMQNLGISSDDAKTAINRLSDGISGLPTTLDSAASGVTKFVSKNGDIDKSTKYFLAMNDAIVAGGQSSEIQASAVEQLSQAYSKGTMDMTEWRSLQTAMPAQLNQVAQAMGMTTDALGEGLRNGTISMDEFMDKIVELDSQGVNGLASFHEQAQSATGGIATSFANLKTAVVRNVAGIINAINGEGGENRITNALKSASEGIDSFGASFKSAASNIMDVWDTFMSSLQAEGIGESIRALQNHFAEVFAKVGESEAAMRLFNTVMEIAKSIASTLGDAFSYLSSNIGDTQSTVDAISFVLNVFSAILGNIKDFFDQLSISAGEFLAPAIERLKVAWDMLTTAAAPLIEALCQTDIGGQSLGETLANIVIAAITGFVEVLTLLVNIITVVIECIKGIIEIGVSVGTTISEIISGFGEMFSAIPQVIGDLWNTLIQTFTQGGTDIANAAGEAWEGIKNFFFNGANEIGNSVATFIGQVGNFFSNLWNNVCNIASNMWDGIINFFSSGISNAVNAVSNFNNSIGTFFSNLWSNVCNTVSNMWNGIVSFFSDGVSNVINFVASIPGNILSIFSNIGSLLSNAGHSLISGFVNGIHGAVSFIWDAIRSIPDGIFSILSNAGSWLVESGKSMIYGLVDGIWAAISWATDSVSNALSWIRNLFPFSPAKEGPFSGKGWTLYSGEAIMESVGEGIESKADSVKNIVDDALGEVHGAISTDATVTTNGSALSSGVYEAVKQALIETAISVQIDGRELAGATAGYMDKELGIMQIRRARA